MLSKKILKNLSKVNVSEYTNYGDVDLVIGGGGFFGYYVIGIDRIIKKLHRFDKINVVRYAGTSVGSITCVLMVCSVPTNKVIEIYEHVKNKHNYFDLLAEELRKVLPSNAYELCSGKVFISITYFTWFGLKNIIVSNYKDNDDLISACMSSSCMPFFVTNRFFYKFRNLYTLDGCLTNNTAFFLDNKRKQIVVKPNSVFYYKRLMVAPLDDSIEGLIVKGAIEFDKFLRNENHNFTSISWYSVKEKPDLVQKVTKFIMVLIFRNRLVERFLCRNRHYLF